PASCQMQSRQFRVPTCCVLMRPPPTSTLFPYTTLFRSNDLVYGDWDEETRVGVEWMFPLNEEENRGFPDKDQIYGLPFNFVMQAPYLIRRDHVEKAGLDFDEHYPIRDTDHYIELCKEIQAKAGVPYPTEVYGAIWDFGDTQLNGWIRSLSIEDS